MWLRVQSLEHNQPRFETQLCLLVFIGFVIWASYLIPKLQIPLVLIMDNIHATGCCEN